VCILGGRYGWVPDKLPPEERELIQTPASSSSHVLLVVIPSILRTLWVGLFMFNLLLAAIHDMVQGRCGPQVAARSVQQSTDGWLFFYQLSDQQR